MQISNGVISGSAMSTNGLVYTIGGEVAGNGEVIGGAFAISGQGAASYRGSFAGDAGNGDWDDIFDCSGTWVASRTS